MKMFVCNWRFPIAAVFYCSYLLEANSTISKFPLIFVIAYVNFLNSQPSVCVIRSKSLQWRHNGCDNVWNHQPYYRSLNRLFRRRSKETSKLRVTGLCEGNSPGTGEFPAQMASYAENVSIWWRHHVMNDLSPNPQYFSFSFISNYIDTANDILFVGFYGIFIVNYLTNTKNR